MTAVRGAGDMGLSKRKLCTFVSGSMRGTIPWMAPELFFTPQVSSCYGCTRGPPPCVRTGSVRQTLRPG